MDARVLGGEVAAPGVQLLHEPASVGKLGGHDRAGRERRERHLEPVAALPGIAQEDEPAPDRADREVHRPVVVVVSRRQPASVHARPAVRPAQDADVREPRPRTGARDVLDDLQPARVVREVRHRDRAVRDRELRASVEGEIGPRRSPSGRARRERGAELRARVAERGAGSRRAGERRMRLPPRVRHDRDRVVRLRRSRRTRPPSPRTGRRRPPRLPRSSNRKPRPAGSARAPPGQPTFSYSWFGSSSFAT